MSEPFLRTQGIILRAFPFRDYDQILSLFTADAGVIKVICYGSRSQRSKLRGLCTPLTSVEIVYREKKGEIFSCQDMSLLGSHEQLKQNYNQMEAACDILNALYVSQMPGKAAPQLYALMQAYFKKMPLTTDPWVLAHSFRLKLLRHDGLLTFPFVCGRCDCELWSGAYHVSSEIHCVEHQLPGALYLQEADLYLLYHLAVIQSYSELVAVEVPPGFRVKVEHLFKSSLAS